MADEILRSRHAFGSLSNVQNAIEDGKIDAYDILFLEDDNSVPRIGWLDKNGELKLVTDEKADLSEVEADIEALETELANKADAEEVEADISALESKINTKLTAEEVKTILKESEDSLVEIVEF